MSHLHIVEKKLGRKHICGQCSASEDFIEIEIRLGPLEKLRTYVHELLHYAYPDMTEGEVLLGEKLIGKALWNSGFRKIYLKTRNTKRRK